MSVSFNPYQCDLSPLTVSSLLVFVFCECYALLINKFTEFQSKKILAREETMTFSHKLVLCCCTDIF